MYKEKRILVLIPARSGSKGLSGKNIRLFLEKSLITRTIQQANSSKLINKVIVSTDDKKTALIAKRFGAEVLFLRPKYLARDNTPKK